MKGTFLRIAAAAALALGATVSMQAQNASTVEYGRSVLIFDPSFTSGISSLGAQLGGVGFSSIDSTGTIVFPVVSGAVDLQTGLGEVNQQGGISVLIGGGAPVRLQNLAVSTLGSPVITALLVVNNKVISRITLFDLALPAGTALPLTTTAGVLQLNGLTVTMDASGAAAINGVFGSPALKGGTLVGTMSLYLVLSPNSSV